MPFTIQPTAYRISVTSALTSVVVNSGRVEMVYLVRNTDATFSVFVGDANVTPSTGFEIKAGDAIAFGLNDAQTIYGVTAAATVVLDVIERMAQ